MTTHIGMLLYPGLTQLDLTAPFELFHRVPETRVHLVWKNLEPVRDGAGLALLPTTTLSDCPRLDVLFVPGGFGQRRLRDDQAVMSFVREQGQSARYVTSVCTGALVLGAAGLLEGYEATTHWAYTDQLAQFGARYVPKRVVVDRNRITGGGVTAGLDFGFRIVAELAGENVAKLVQLGLEYDPEPPFQCGNPELAGPDLVRAVRERLAERERRLSG